MERLYLTNVRFGRLLAKNFCSDTLNFFICSPTLHARSSIFYFDSDLIEKFKMGLLEQLEKLGNPFRRTSRKIALFEWLLGSLVC
jgi:hypothetical protein